MAQNFIECEGINSKGFGIFPKKLAIDTRISADAKAIYAYLTSYAGAGRSAFPGVDLMMVHLGMGRQRFYNARAILEAYGYIKIQTTYKIDEKTGRGRRGNNIYILCEYPQENPELIQKIEDKKTNKKAKETDSKTTKKVVKKAAKKPQKNVAKKAENNTTKTVETVGITATDKQYDYKTVDNKQFYNDTYNNNSINNNSINNNSINNKNRKEKIKEKKEDKLSCTDLSVIIPDEFKHELDKYFIKRLKKDKTFYTLDFTNGMWYNVFADAVVKTQLQDNVEVLELNQYAYFKKTLTNMIEPLIKKREMLSIIEENN